MTSGKFVTGRSIGMDLMTRFNILNSEVKMAPFLEHMIRYAPPVNRKKAVRLLALLDQDIAKNRDVIDKEIKWPL